MNLVAMFVLLASEGSVQAGFSELSPRIDGVIETIWHQADSAYDFVQYAPHEGENATEPTIVYLLYDNANLYVAFRCYTTNRKPVARLMGGEEWVALYLDTFSNKTTCYFFRVTASGLRYDGLVLDDGRQFDSSWDGVWYCAARCFDEHYEIEIKIPFESIRYGGNIAQWGINFKRFLPASQETDYWVAVHHKEGLRVSKFGQLKGLRPCATGYYLEFLPEAVLRYDKHYNKDPQKTVGASFNMKWDVTSQTNLNATILPDFAQIESDPYDLNLTKYPTYLSERRSFFVEGSDIFKFSEFEEGYDFFKPLMLFYSRKIGKSLDTKTVPILGGLKITTKSTEGQLGFLSVLTDSVDGEMKRLFATARMKRRIFERSEMGLLFNSAVVNKSKYYYAIGGDLAHRFRANQLLFQFASSNHENTIGSALSVGYRGYIGNFLAKVSSFLSSNSFDVSEIGYVPWEGTASFFFSIGPLSQFPLGKVQNVYFAPGVQLIEDTGTNERTRLLNLDLDICFRRGWALDADAQLGPSRKVETDFVQKGGRIWLSGTDAETYEINIGVRYSYDYNYLRNRLAYQGGNYIRYANYFLSRFCLSLATNVWLEWNVDNKIDIITTSTTPRLDIRINREMTIGIFNETVFKISDTNFAAKKLISNRIGFLFSWNFSPKSWFYLAGNDYYTRNEQDNFTLSDRIGVIKLKYLIYF